jgi:hypothetical protein
MRALTNQKTMNCSNKLINSDTKVYSLHCVNILVVFVLCGIAALAGWCVLLNLLKSISIAEELSSIVLFLCIRYYLLCCFNEFVIA